MVAGGGSDTTEIRIEGENGEWTLLPESGNLPGMRYGPNNIISHDGRMIVVGCDNT